MNLSRAIDSTLLEKKFLNLVVVCGLVILVALATKWDLVAVVYTGSVTVNMYHDIRWRQQGAGS